MPIASYGDRGHPLLIFPVGQGDCLEVERIRLIQAIEPHLFAGRCHAFSAESINRHAWMNPEVPPPEAARRQALYAAYVEDEVVPYIRRVTGAPDARIAVAGAGFGAFHAANQLFRRPDLFGALIAMSGFYDLEPELTRGYWDEDVYFNNPVAYVSNLHDEETLELLREHTQIHLIVGRGRGEAPERSEQLSRVLTMKGIPHDLDVWGPDVDHDPVWWRRMLAHYVGERLGW
ncbi:MAG: hypothetical protein IT372_14725 [Polyangiaceae bacterium]|nr:hypothetical protein [Polyangiaceae bacterium]